MTDVLDLPIQHTIKAPVFVIGAARSGTSLLCTLIRRYLKVSFGTESQFIVRRYRTLHHYGDLQIDRTLRRLVDDIAKERCFERWTLRFGFVLDRERVIQRMSTCPKSYANVLRAFFEQLAQYLGMERWGDKTPEYNKDLPILWSLYPDAQFVHIVRDGRDVALSGFRMHFGAGNVYRAAENWRSTMLRIENFCATLPERQLLTLQYETLLREPVQMMERVSGFLGIANAPDFIPTLAADIPLQLRQDNGEKWPAAMPLQDQRLFEVVAGDELRAAGYRTPHNTHRHVSVAERTYWELNHLLHKALRRHYWSDTLYRASLRVRTGALSARH